MKHLVNYDFSTVVGYAGANHLFAFAAGQEVDLEGWAAAELAVQVPGALTPLAAIPAVEVYPAAEREADPVETIEGTLPKAKTRAVRKPANKKAKP